ncbi:MAG: DUF2878 family protein [Deltaproteobacteria bacterium]|nr:MAG: DUF2878 family protein [Deltaproteobacteria bacterium]
MKKMEEVINRPEPGAYQTTLGELLREAAVLIITALAICLFSQNTKIMSIVFAAIVIFRFVFFNRRGDVIFFLMGVILGGGNDLMSMWRGVYYYTPATILPVPIPVWMLLFWGEIFVFFRKLIRYGPFLRPETPRKRLLDLPLALDIILFAVYRIIIYRYASVPWLPDALYAGILVARLLLLPPKTDERKLMITILLLGPVYEIALIRCGLYVYQNGFIWGLPLWLIIWWVFIIRVFKAIIDRIEHSVATRLS